MKHSLLIGRYQPFHDGHNALVQKLLDEGKNVCIAVRNTGKDENNPWSFEEREKMIRLHFPNNENVKVIKIPDIEEVCYGRKVGWGIRMVSLTPEIEKISASEIRGNNAPEKNQD